MLKILQARLQYYMNRELPDVQAGFRKGRGTRDQIDACTGSLKKQENSRKTSTFASLTTLCVSQQTVENSLRDENTRPPYLPPEKSVHQSRRNSSVQFSHSVVSNSLRPHESQHARPPCPSPTCGVHSNSCPKC